MGRRGGALAAEPSGTLPGLEVPLVLARPVVYVHPTCHASYEAVKTLAREGLLGSVELRGVVNPAEALGRRIWSVPWLLVDGRPAATDPVDPGELVEAVRGVWQRRVVDPVEAFMATVLHSAYAAAVAYVHGSLKPVLDEALASAAVRAPLSGLAPRSVLEEVEANERRLYEQWEDKLMRALGVSYVRELWWATGGDLDREAVRAAATPATAGAWLLAKASIGRAGLPQDPRLRPGAAEALADFVRRGAAGLLNKVRREQEEILGDTAYWELLRSLGI